jgi:hypothetical protein
MKNTIGDKFDLLQVIEVCFNCIVSNIALGIVNSIKTKITSKLSKATLHLNCFSKMRYYIRQVMECPV